MVRGVFVSCPALLRELCSDVVVEWVVDLAGRQQLSMVTLCTLFESVRF
jgi:hypothetical protein